MMKTDFLFTQPSFIKGVSSILDIGATSTTYNSFTSNETVDNQALLSDWSMVGYDIVEAINEFEKNE